MPIREVAEALRIIREQIEPTSPVDVPLSPASVGAIAAEDVQADLDSPPFDKALMDGYAVRADDARARPNLCVVAEIRAGDSPAASIVSGESARIFTGAPIPGGADAVVKQEQVEVLPDGTIRLHVDVLATGRNILKRGGEMTAGQVVISRGTRLTPAYLGLAAGLGRTAIRTYPIPQVALICTGDEIVEANGPRADGQIRNTNGPMLAALTAQAGAEPNYLGIVGDDRDRLAEVITYGLKTASMLILSGGVSVGKYDHIPEVLATIGVTTHFHQVRMKPGKPLLFGTKGAVPVFGLPGNPVSSFVCFQLFVKPALGRLTGDLAGTQPYSAKLGAALRTNNDRPTYHPALLRLNACVLTVTPLPWLGSADLRAFSRAEALIVLPAGEFVGVAGDVVTVIPFEPIPRMDAS